MDDTDTDNIHRATLGGNAGTSDYMHKARKLNPPDAPAEFKLKDTGTARCHILADSSVRIIVSSLYVKLKSTLGNSEAEKAAFKLPEPVKTFINAMTNGVNETQISNWMIDDIKQKSNDNLKDVLDWLSHGQANLFFGDAERNLKILHGLDVPIEDGRPTRNAAAIIDAVRSLPQEMLPWGTMMSALQTTRQRDGGSALSSSSTATFNPEIRFAMPHHPNRLKRTKSVSR